jgi:hypothetical protein
MRGVTFYIDDPLTKELTRQKNLNSDLPSPIVRII